MKKLLLALLLLASPAFGQSVQMSPPVTRLHVPYWVTSGVIGDGGSSADSPISSFGVTNNGGAGICVNSDFASANTPPGPGRNQLCFGAKTSGAATISLQNQGAASPQALNFVINGVTSSFPTPTTPLPVASGGTGATTAAGAQTNLGLGTMAVQNANAVAITGGTITGLPIPTNPPDAATKAYTDGLVQGLTIIASSRLATAAVLPNTPTYANGSSGVGATLTAGSNTTLTVDGTVANLNDVILVNNQAAPAQNGIYTVTTAGGGVPWVLTRATYFNQASNMTVGKYTFITAGSTNINTSWVLSATVTTVGTTAVVFNQFSNSGSGVSNIGGLTGSVACGTGINCAAGTISNTGPTTAGPNTWTGFQTFRALSGTTTVQTNDGALSNTTLLTDSNTQLKLSNNNVPIEIDSGVGGVLNSGQMVLNTNGTVTIPSLNYTPPGTGGVATTIQSVLQRTIWANDYGAVCNGSTDDHVAFQNAINEGQTLGAPVKFIFNCAITTALSVTAGLDFSGAAYNSTLSPPGTIDAIDISTTAAVYLHDFTITYSSTPTTTSAITVSAPATFVNNGSRFWNLTINSAFIGVNYLNADIWSLSNSIIASSGITNGSAVHVADSVNADAGDNTIYGNTLQAGPGGIVINWVSSGGLRVQNNKLLSNGAAVGIQFSLASGGINTSDVIITGNSIEGFQTSGSVGISFGRQGTTGSLGNIIIANNQIGAPEFCVLHPTDANGSWTNDITVTGNICQLSTVANGVGVVIDSAQGIMVANNNFISGVASNIPTQIGAGVSSLTACVVGPNSRIGTWVASSINSCQGYAPF